MTRGTGAVKNTPFDRFLPRHLPRELQIQRLRWVIEGELTPLQQYTLEAYHYQGMTLQQIAEFRGVAKSTVWRTLKRAEGKLQRFLQY